MIILYKRICISQGPNFITFRVFFMCSVQFYSGNFEGNTRRILKESVSRHHHQRLLSTTLHNDGDDDDVDNCL